MKRPMTPSEFLAVQNRRSRGATVSFLCATGLAYLVGMLALALVHDADRQPTDVDALYADVRASKSRMVHDRAEDVRIATGDEDAR